MQNNQNSHTLLVGVSLGSIGSIYKVEHMCSMLNEVPPQECPEPLEPANVT